MASLEALLGVVQVEVAAADAVLVVEVQVESAATVMIDRGLNRHFYAFNLKRKGKFKFLSD